MLGPSKSGKTCFLATMYNVLESGVQGCSLSTRDLDQGAALNDLFQSLRKEEGEARWPMGTQEGSIFHFDFNVHHDTLLTLEWLDYRGGALKDKAAEADVQAILQHLGDSFAILISVDGELLKNTRGGLDADDSLGVKRINQFLKRARDTAISTGRPLPVVCLVITKGDAIMDGDEVAKAEMAQAVKNLYNSLTANGSGWEVKITAVSLGEGLHLDKQREINPIAVHEPIFYIALKWCDHAVIKEDARTREQRAELKDWLAFAERHKNGDLNHQQKMAQFMTHVSSVLKGYEDSLASVQRKHDLLKSLCDSAQDSKQPVQGES